MVLGHDGCGAIHAALEAKYESFQHRSRIQLRVDTIVPVLEGLDARLPPAERQGRAAVAIVRERLETPTLRELQVLRHVLSGQTSKEIAASLGTAEKTLKIQRGRVMEKMQAESLAHLLRMAGQAGVRPE